MVKHERQRRDEASSLERQRQLTREQGEVEAQSSGGREPTEPPAHGRARQPVRIRLREQRVPDPGQPGSAGKRPVRGDLVADISRGQVGPPDDRPHQGAGARDRQQVRRLIGIAEHLDHDRAGDALGDRGRRQVGDGERPAQRSQFLLRRPRLVAGQPGLLAHGQVPQVVVGVDHA